MHTLGLAQRKGTWNGCKDHFSSSEISNTAEGVVYHSQSWRSEGNVEFFFFLLTQNIDKDLMAGHCGSVSKGIPGIFTQTGQFCNKKFCSLTDI